MSRIAIISDVHANIEALEAVLEEIDRLGADRIYSLGDTVGYGPNPVECFKLVRERSDLMLMGNHELALVESLGCLMNPEAEKAVEWTRNLMEEAKLLDQVTQLPKSHQEGDTLFVHGSVREPLLEYVTELDHRGFSKFDEIVEILEKDFTSFRLCFVGHNHQPFLATKEGFIHPHGGKTEFDLGEEKLYISVGSVGQPRDEDARSCFAIFEGSKVQFHRVSYSVEQTVKKIKSAGLPVYLAYRLLKGK